MNAPACVSWPTANDYSMPSPATVKAVPVIARRYEVDARPVTDWRDGFAAFADRLRTSLVPPGAAEEQFRFWALTKLAATARISAQAQAIERSSGFVLFEDSPGIVSVKLIDAPDAVLPENAKSFNLPLFARFSYALVSWMTLLTRRHYASVRDALEWLLADESAFEGDVEPDIASFRALLSFLSSAPETRSPAITIGDDGAFAATWQTGTSRRISLRFRAADSVLVTAIERDAAGRRIFAKVEEVDGGSLRTFLAEHNLGGWMLE